MQDKRFLPIDLTNITHWSPTVGQARDTLLQGNICGAHLPDEIGCNDYAADPAEVDRSNDMAREAISAGRLIDFGMLPNATIMAGGNQGGPLYTAGAIGVPFRDPWVFMHGWEGGISVYLVNLIDHDQPAGGRCEIAELQPIRVRGTPTFLLSDRAMLDTTITDPQALSRYACRSAPSPFRFLPEMSGMNNGMAPENAAAGNVLDPLMTALLILNTNGVARETVRAPEKLQRARAKSGKPPIPPYDRIDAAQYVTAILARGQPRARSEAQGGHHASPIPHLRRGHMREYPNGRRTFIRDTLVRVTDEARAEFAKNRSHYTAGREP